MKQIIVLTLALAAGLALVACGNKRSRKEEQQPKILVLYYSQTGVTRQVAEEISARLGNADIEEILAVEPYSGTYEETIERSRMEREHGIIPEIQPLKSNVQDYDFIFLGFPVWYGTYALPVFDLLQKVDFTGKSVVPFCTFGSGGLESSMADLKQALPNATILSGYGVREKRLNAMPAEVERFLAEEGFTEGEYEPLPDYSEAQPVGEAETAVFNAAVNGYKYPLGTPVTFGMRALEDRTDYEFTVKTTRPDGSETSGVIYVSVGTEEGSVPEFTKVVR